MNLNRPLALCHDAGKRLPGLTEWVHERLGREVKLHHGLMLRYYSYPRHQQPRMH